MNKGSDAELLTRIRAWKDERYAIHKAERREAMAADDHCSASNAVGAMLELLELESWITRALTKVEDTE